MAFTFQKHYTREEARVMLPKVRHWLKRLAEQHVELERCEECMSGLMAPGCDLGGDVVNKWVRTLASLQEVLAEFQRREIQVKDVSRGLVDFPTVIGGKEVFLCWEQDEEDIEFWHDLDAGYGGRERL
jgi:hypothetical protein